VTAEFSRLYVDQTPWYKAMSLKAFCRAALRERLSAKRQGAKKAASPKSREFNELLDRLAMHLNWKSVTRLKRFLGLDYIAV
jgi:hypothetical protein